MSEIKPRQVTLSSDVYYNWKIVKPLKAEGPFPVEMIEAAPVLQMMNELAAILLTRDCDKIINHEGSGMFNKHHPGCFKCKALENYKSFLSLIESEGK